MTHDVPPLAEFFRAVLNELKKRLTPSEFQNLLKDCEEDVISNPGEEKTYHDQRND